jgi:hypothetical protein
MNSIGKIEYAPNYVARVRGLVINCLTDPTAGAVGYCHSVGFAD